MKPTVPVLYGSKYKRNSYAYFIALLLVTSCVVLVLISVIDYSLKSDEPILTFVTKSDSEYKQENDRLQHQLDSIKVVARRVSALEARLKANPTSRARASNAETPVLPHYSGKVVAYGAAGYDLYLIDKMKFYYQRADSLERWINTNN